MEKEPIDFNKIFKEISDFIDKLTDKSRYNHVFFSFCAQSGLNSAINTLLADKKLFLPSETRKKLYKLMDEGVPNMICWYYELKKLEESKELKESVNENTVH